MSQGQLAAVMSLPPPSVSCIERGLQHIKDENLFVLIQRHKLNANWLLTGEGPMFLPAAMGTGTDPPTGGLGASPPGLASEISEGVSALVREAVEKYVPSSPSADGLGGGERIRQPDGSMAPLVPEGATVGYDPAVRDVAEILKSPHRLVVVAGKAGAPVVRRLDRVSPDQVVFMALAPLAAEDAMTWRTRPPTGENPIVGMVAWIYRTV